MNNCFCKYINFDSFLYLSILSHIKAFIFKKCSLPPEKARWIVQSVTRKNRHVFSPLRSIIWLAIESKSVLVSWSSVSTFETFKLKQKKVGSKKKKGYRLYWLSCWFGVNNVKWKCVYWNFQLCFKQSQNSPGSYW